MTGNENMKVASMRKALEYFTITAYYYVNPASIVALCVSSAPERVSVLSVQRFA